MGDTEYILIGISACQGKARELRQALEAIDAGRKADNPGLPWTEAEEILTQSIVKLEETEEELRELLKED